MARKNDVKKIHLYIDDFTPFVNERCIGFIVRWSSDIGFGEYTLSKSDSASEWCGDSECMDNNEDKEFITELMRLFIEKLVITE